ncbi:hypothetical protein N7509_008505 [Penicillium cosmopolitanum]|uniref:Extracellular membrane protein CFEM domain-containing protein n=1 Tax=Penicillium cosmopolitanum TaxID=1131564 RepID=A0A9W9VMQ6_9EURO|nr:uncharacterized protein N7509_008505 [Penicillium cosmopolitanum]KAJ5385964.1 hypothetical protein N7509_008505 [Penicillium cosmopolitanum]
MVSFKTLLLTAFVSVAVHAANDTDTECPAGWLPNTFKVTRCCSGGMTVINTTAYCCVYDMRLYKEALTNTALLYETATTTTTEDDYNHWATLKDTCVAKIPYTLPASDYSSQVSSAAKKAEATPTNTSATTTNSAATSEVTSGSGSQASTPTSNAAMPLATAGDVALGGAALAAALFVL